MGWSDTFVQALKDACTLARCVAAFTLAAALAAPVHAQTLDLSGKTVTLAIATPSGGGYDLYGRMCTNSVSAAPPGMSELTVTPVPSRSFAQISVSASIAALLTP